MNLVNNNKLKIFLIIILIMQLFLIANKKLDFNFNILLNSFTKNFGSVYSLPKKLIELKDYSVKSGFKEINLSKKLKQDNFFNQRSVEFLFPIKILNESKKTFFSIKEEIPNTCEIHKKLNYFIFAIC
jgi:hypothetical protein